MSNRNIIFAAAGQQEAASNFNQVVLLLHGDGTNGAQNNTFLDSSTNNFTITRNGNPTQGSFAPFSRTSGNLDDAYDPAVNGGSADFSASSGNYLLFPSSTQFRVGTGDFTIECWFYAIDDTQNSGLFQVSGTAGAFTIPNVNQLSIQLFGGDILLGNNTAYSQSVTSYNANEWIHVALVRSSGTLKVYVNGVSELSVSDTHNYTGSYFAVGAFYVSSLSVVGYISDFRFVNGTAVYTTNFTPPTAPLTAISGTSALLKFTNAGIFDNAGKNNLETVGNAQIDTTTKKYGTGSIEFDGTGDWLRVSNSGDIQLGTGDFTIEFWVYLASGDTGSNRGLVAKGGASTGWLVSLDSSEKVVFTYTTSTITSSGAITTNAWNHIAVVRQGTGSNETKIYIGGTNDGTGTVSTDFNQTEVMYVGANRAAGDPMKGFIDDLRITKGVARYTANFTPPTQAFPDI